MHTPAVLRPFRSGEPVVGISAVDGIRPHGAIPGDVGAHVSFLL